MALIPEKIESFYSFKFDSIEEEKELNLIKIKIPFENIEVNAAEYNNFLPEKVFSDRFSHYFLDLAEKEFNLNQIFLHNLEKSKKLVSFRQQMKDRNNYSLLEFAILKNMKKIVDKLIDNLSQSSDIDISYFILLLLENGNVEIFKKFMGIFFGDDKHQIFDFILNKDLLMKIAGIGNEHFLLTLLHEYMIPLGTSKLIPENKLVFSANRNDVSYKNNNIFHYIAIYKMGTFMFEFLEYLRNYKFESDAKKMKYFLEEFLLMKNEESSGSSNVQKRSPIYYAIMNKFYEMICLCDLNEISLTTSFDKESILKDNLLLRNRLGYFSRFLISNQQKSLSLIPKPNYFYEHFENLLKFHQRIKEFLDSNSYDRKIKKKIKTAPNKRKNSMISLSIL